MIDTVVITDRDGGSVILSGSTVEECQQRPIPAGMLGDLPRMLHATMTTCLGAEPATLVIPSTDQLAEHIEGWTLTGVDADTGWYQATPKTGQMSRHPRRVHLCVLDRINGANSHLFAPGWSPGRISANLRTYRDLIGPWYANAGTSGVALMRELGERPSTRTRRPRWLLPVDQYMTLRDELDLPGGVSMMWHPGSRAVPLTGHRWDVRAAYLAAAQAATLATDAPEHSAGPRPFDPGRAGRWRVRLTETHLIPHMSGTAANDVIGPPLWHHRAERDDGTLWLTTPVVEELHRLGVGVEVLDSVTAPGARHLRAWAETIRDALYTAIGEQLPAEIIASIKFTYKWAVGLINKPGRRVYRPDWHATIVDLARVLLYRKLTAVWRMTGHWPIAVDTDSVWYPAEVVDGAADRFGPWVKASQGVEITRDESVFGGLLGEGALIGQFRYEGYEGKGDSHE